jgi:hypothetical protein
MNEINPDPNFEIEKFKEQIRKQTPYHGYIGRLMPDGTFVLYQGIQRFSIKKDLKGGVK